MRHFADRRRNANRDVWRSLLRVQVAEQRQSPAQRYLVVLRIAALQNYSRPRFRGRSSCNASRRPAAFAKMFESRDPSIHGGWTWKRVPDRRANWFYAGFA